MRTTVAVAATLVIAAVALAACGADGSPGPSGDTGSLVIRPAYEPPPPGEPMVFGGYGFFADVGELNEQRIPYDGTLRVELPAGSHQLTIVTRAQSDVLMPGQEEGEPLEVTAECVTEVEVPAGGTVEVVYRAVGGSTCEITPEA
jgi:hypothetical protein